MPTEKQYYNSTLQYFSSNWFKEVTDLPQDVQPILSQVLHYRESKDEHIFYAFRGYLKMGNKNLLTTIKPIYFNQNNVTKFVQILRKLQQKKKLNGKEGCDLFIAIITKKKLIVQFRPGFIIRYKNKGKTCNRFKYEYLSYRSAVLFFDTSIVQLTCIATYIDKVVNDRSAILHYNDAQKIPYSFELIPQPDGNYYLNQIYGDYDRDCPTNIEEQVKKWFE